MSIDDEIFDSVDGTLASITDRISRKKPVGSAEKWLLESIPYVDYDDLKQEIIDSGKHIYEHDKDGEVILYVYDRTALGRLLKKKESIRILEESGWPQDPDEFVRRVAQELVDSQENPGLYTLIADAYGDKTNPDRTDPPRRGWFR